MKGQNNEDVKFDEPFRPEEWKELNIWLYENFPKEELENLAYHLKNDMEDDMKVEVEDHMEDDMEVEVEDHMENDTEDDMEVEVEDDMEDNMETMDIIDGGKDKLEAAKKLMKAVESIQLHHDLGENVKEKIQTFIDRLEKHRENIACETEQLFIGRVAELKQVVDFLNDRDIFAVAISGIGGQGKSSLARRVCLTLASGSWRLVKADLRKKESTVDVIKSLLAAANWNFPEKGEEECFQEMIQDILHTQSDLLLCLDDCDDVLRNERHKFIRFLNVMINEARESEHKVKLLLTMREKLPEKQKEIRRLKASGELKEVELHELEQEDAIALLGVHTDNKEIDSKIAEAIVKECAYSPLAVSVVAELIKNGKFTPEHLILHLQMDKKNVSKVLKVDSCIKEAINNLDNEHQEALFSLSVFQSSPFDQSTAIKIIGQISMPEKFLQDLCRCHLLEVDNHIERSENKTVQKVKYHYSLHPLVYRVISEWKNPEDLKRAYQSFVSYYEKMVSSIVQLLESNYWKGRKKLEFHKVHILKFYEIMSENPQLLKPYRKKTDDKDVLLKKRTSDLADILLSLVQNRRMFQSEADRALKAGNKNMYIFWIVEKADVFLMLHDKVEIALEYLDQLEEKYPALRELREEPYHLGLVHGIFHKVKAMCRLKQRESQKSIAHFQLARFFFDQGRQKYRQRKSVDKTPYDIFVSRINYYLGQVYLEFGDYDRAEECLMKGHSEAKSMVESRTRKEDKLNEELHWDIPRFYTLYAKIKLLKAKKMHEDEKNARAKLLDEGLEDLEKGIRLDEMLKLDYLDGYYSKLKLKADVNVEKGILKEALRDANNVLDKRREILQPPHTHYTESVYQVGRIYMLIGNELNKKGEKEEARKYWDCSSDYFKELKTCHLKDGGISVDNPVFQDIKRDHIKITRLSGQKESVKQIEKFYHDVGTGAYDPEKKSRIKAMKEMLWTPMEMIKKWYDGGGEDFGDNDDKITQMENLAREQEENMLQGECSGGRRRDSGMGHSSSDLGDSFSSGSGSMSSRMERMHLEKSLSIEDDVFQDSGELKTDTEKKRRLSKKRQKTIHEDQET